MDSPIDDFDPPFAILAPPRQTSPAVFDSPHSGRIYLDSFLRMSRLDALALRRSEDCFVDDMFGAAVDMGCPLLKANFPRAFLDLNREPYELDPAMFADRLPNFANTTSMRVAGGLGTIPRIVSEHEEIYRSRLAFAEVEARIERLYRPYHRALQGLLEQTAAVFGYALLVDCHSMPSRGDSGLGQAEVVFGDLHGTTIAPELLDAALEAGRRTGFRTACNVPYAGGYITARHGRPTEDFHALQVEIDRSLYLAPDMRAPGKGFERTAQLLADVASALCRRAMEPPQSIAAE